MDDKGEIISSCDVDENLALQMWTKGLSPRVVIFNKNAGKKKFVKLSWFEDVGRRLTIKGKKRGVEFSYPLADLVPTMSRILSEYAVYTNFRSHLWRFSLTFERVVHAPAIVFDKSEFATLSEEKRSRLWVADLTGEGKGEGFFRPFFPRSEDERRAVPDGGIFFEESRCGVDDLFKTGAIRRLNGTGIRRWHSPMRVAAAAMLLNFSFCGEDGDRFSDELWRAGNFDKPLSFKLGDARLRGMDRKLVGYVRHLGVMKALSAWSSFDSYKELGDAGYAKKRLVNFPAGLLGRVETSVTFFERDDGMMAFACKPRLKTSHSGGGMYYAEPPQKSHEKQEIIYALPKAAYEAARVDDTTCGSYEDDYFTVAQLAGAKIFETWCGMLIPYIEYFAGFVEM
ncbi:MAG: hypothetical protein LBR38_00175 [Synergistaceae bacterium]|jgi:hypothetical protein|nr:hypothetical protein [Synergistaceae bacterium]